MKMRDFDNNELFNLQVCTGEKVSYFAVSSFTNNYNYLRCVPERSRIKVILVDFTAPATRLPVTLVAAV